MVSAMNGKKELKHQRLINVGKKNPNCDYFFKTLVYSGFWCETTFSVGDLFMQKEDVNCRKHFPYCVSCKSGNNCISLKRGKWYCTLHVI